MDDGLMDGFGAPAAKFDKIGATYEGQILAVEKRPVTDMTTGAVKTYDNGDTIYQFVFTIQTDLREHADDDGQRRIFAKNKCLAAIREAIKKSGHKGSTIGGRIKVQHHAVEPPKTRGFSPAKLFRAAFTPPPTKPTDQWESEEPAPQRPAPRQQASEPHRSAVDAPSEPDSDLPF